MPSPLAMPLVRPLAVPLTGWNGAAKPVISKIAFVGDSITSQIGTATAYYTHGAWAFTAARLNQSLDIVWNGSVPYFATAGKRADEILTLHGASAAASAADAVCVLAGINDLAQSATSVTTAARIQALRDYFLAAGKSVILCEILPPKTGDSYASLASNVVATNLLIRAMEGGKCVVCRWASAVETSPGSGLGVADCFSDSLHPNATAMRLLSVTLAATISPWVPARDIYAGISWVSPNPTLTGSAGLATGWAIDAYSGLTKASNSLIARGGALGNWQQIVLSGTTGVGSFRYGYGTGLGGWSVGDRVEMIAEIECDDDCAASGGYMYPVCTFQAGNTNIAYLTGVANTLTTDARITSGILRSPPATIPSGNTGIWPTITTNGGGTYRIGRIGLRKI